MTLLLGGLVGLLSVGVVLWWRRNRPLTQQEMADADEMVAMLRYLLLKEGIHGQGQEAA